MPGLGSDTRCCPSVLALVTELVLATELASELTSVQQHAARVETACNKSVEKPSEKLDR